MGSAVRRSEEKTLARMAEAKVPVTMRDFFFDDPFFKRSWDDFDKVRDAMFPESRDMWKRFDEDFRDSACMKNNIMLEPGMELGKELSKEEARSLAKQDSELIRTKEDDSKMEVSLDTAQYRPDELKITVDKGVVCVEGRHEGKAEDGSKMVSRSFSRKYTLPKDAKLEDVVSNLSSDGVLVITAPKNAPAITNVKVDQK